MNMILVLVLVSYQLVLMMYQSILMILFSLKKFITKLTQLFVLVALI